MYIKTLDEHDMTNLKLKVTKLYMYFLACDENQSNNKGLVSFKYIKYQHTNDVTSMANAIEYGLNTLYREYFDSVEVTCKADKISGGLARLLVNITVSENDVTTTLYREISLDPELPTNVIEYFKQYVD